MLRGGNDKSVAGLDEKLADYQKLREQFDRVRVQLRRAEEQKQTVNQRIYEKVTAEYNRKLDELRSRMSPLKEDLDGIRVQIERELAEATRTVEQGEEKLAEIRFRHVVGEYTDQERDALLKTDAAALDECRRRHSDLTLLLSAFDAASNEGGNGNNERPADELAGAPGERPAPEALTPARDPAPPTPPAEPRPATPPRREPGGGFVDPNEWFSEPVPQETAAAPAGTDDGVEVRVSDRRPESTAPPRNSGQGFPNLVMKSGPNSGREIPLLPMTMSVGREHDNNIELKDPEVARYHARLRYERGEFIVEDLDSSTGTFLNGLRVKEAVLHDGDVLRLGGTELAVEYVTQTN